MGRPVFPRCDLHTECAGYISTNRFREVPATPRRVSLSGLTSRAPYANGV